MSEASRGTLLCVANYRPDVGFAWWLMENFWIEFAAMASRNGLQPLLVYPQGGDVPAKIHEAGIPTRVQPFPGKGLGGLFASLKLVHARRVRVIYFTDREFSSFAYVLLRLAGVRCIINHDHTPGDRPRIGGFKGAVKALWRGFRPAACDLQLCVSPLIRERAIENARIPAERVVVVQNGIEPIECSTDRSYARRVLGLEENALVCFTVGRAHPYKRIDFVIEVAQRYQVEHGHADLVFVHCGDGPDMDRLRSLVRQAGLEDRFVFAGVRTDVKALLCSADIAIHASKGEAFSLAIVEYMSAGLAVLVPDVPSVCQAVREGETGRVYPDGDAGAVAIILARLARDPAERRKLGTAAAEEVRRVYSISRMNTTFRSTLAPLVSRAARDLTHSFKSNAGPTK